MRHNLTNVLFAAVTPERAEVSSYFTVGTHVDDTWLIKHRQVSMDWADPNSAMAGQTSGG